MFGRLGLRIDEEQWGKGEKFLENVKTGFQAVIAALAIHKVEEMITSVIDLGGQLNDTAQKTGLSVESLQEYGYVAQLNSSSAESFAHAITKLSRGMAEADKSGTGPVVDGLKKLGIAFKDPSFHNLSLDDRVQTIATKLSEMEDGTKKTALAMEVFGRSGAELIPTLNDLGKNGAQLKEEFKALGGELTGEQTAALDDLGDNIDRIKTAVKGLKNQAVAALIPTLKEMVDGTLEWVKANRAVISNTISTVVGTAITLFTALGKAVSFVVQTFQWLYNHEEFVQKGLTIIAVLVSSLIAEMILLGIESALAWIAVIGPILLVIAAIAAVTLVVMDVWSAISNGKGVTASVFSYIGGVLRSWQDSLLALVDKVGEAFVDLWEGIASGAKAAFDALLTYTGVQLLIDVYDYFKSGGGQGALNAFTATPDQLMAQAKAKEAGAAATGDVVNTAQTINSPSQVTSTTESKAQTVTIGGAQINISMVDGDPQKVASAVRREIDDHWRAQMAQAHGNL